jgi:hypothetical protein
MKLIVYLCTQKLNLYEYEKKNTFIACAALDGSYGRMGR